MAYVHDLSRSPTSLMLFCQKMDAAQVYSKPRQVVHQDRNQKRKEYFTVEAVSYNPYFGSTLFRPQVTVSARKFVCATHDKNREKEHLRADHTPRPNIVGHLLPFRFELVEVLAT